MIPFGISVIVDEKPDALIFTDLKMFGIRAWVCGQCGYTEFYAASPKSMPTSFKRSLAGKKPKNKKP